MKKLLSAVAVPKLGSGEYWDAIVPGLALRVGARRRTWTLRHRVGGKNRRDILGYFPALSLAEARIAAGKLAERIDQGAAVPTPAVHPRGALTLGGLIDRYEALRMREGGRTKTLARRHAHAAAWVEILSRTSGGGVLQGRPARRPRRHRPP